MPYIWEQADHFVKEWLPDQGYKIDSSEIEEDCIGYRCYRNNETYTIFVYAFGEERTAQLDGDHCIKLTKLPYAEGSIVLVLYLHVDEQENGDGELVYEVQSYAGKSEPMELWRVITVQERNILDFYPRKEINDMVFRFIAAYNNKSIDTFEAIFTPDVYIDLIDGKGRVFNDAVFGQFSSFYERFGKMKLAYLRNSDVVFSSVPYLEGFGYFSFSVTRTDGKINSITEHPPDGKYKELWVTDLSVDDCPIDIVPPITTVEFLAPKATQRFAVKVVFENGEVKKFTLPIKSQDEANEVITLKGYSFTDKIWRNGRLSADRQRHTEAMFEAFEHYGQGIDFINGYSLGKVRLYHDSTPYYEPAACDETVFENDDLKIVKFAEWKTCSLYRVADDLNSDGASECTYKVLLPGGGAFNVGGISTFARADGMRATGIEFSYMGSFQDGVARVAVDDFGYGYIKPDLTFAIPPKYSYAKDFSEGYAVATTASGYRVIIDKDGREWDFARELSSKRYKNICACSEGMFRASVIDEFNFVTRNFRLAYHHDDDCNMGIWGFVNTQGVEVIAPQYIFAYDFEDGMALVCKGKWEYKDRWDERENTGGWWSDEMLWGFIDKEGNEVIPCKYDEIQFFQKDNGFEHVTEYFQVHFGGYPDGKWCIIDRQGQLMDETYFEDVDCTVSKDGCFAFYAADKWSEPDDVPMGIYSIPEKRILFTPRFLNVNFMDDGNFRVEVFDEALGRKVEKIIDCQGRDVFASEYSSIYDWKEPYEVVIYEYSGDGERRALHGLIDKNGNEILPCKYDAVYWNGISYEEKQIICKDSATGKYGVINFDETTVIPARYFELQRVSGTEFLSAQIGAEEEYSTGLLLTDGTEVLPFNYSRIDINGETVLTHSEDGSALFRIERKGRAEVPYLQKRDCPIEISLLPRGADWTDMYVRFNGHEIKFDITGVMGHQVSDLVRALYWLHPSQIDTARASDIVETVDDIYDTATGKSWFDIPIKAEISFASEPGEFKWTITREPTLADEFSVKIRFSVNYSDEENRVYDLAVEYRDLCYALCNALTISIKDYGFAGFFHSANHDNIPLYQLLWLKAYALGKSAEFKLRSRSDGMGDFSILADEIELLLFDM
jgi:hypothetical protein